jgi:hypothetical protein
LVTFHSASLTPSSRSFSLLSPASVSVMGAELPGVPVDCGKQA